MTIAEICTIVGCVLLGATLLFLIISNKSRIVDLEEKVETLEARLLDLINKENENENN